MANFDLNFEQGFVFGKKTLPPQHMTEISKVNYNNGKNIISFQEPI